MLPVPSIWTKEAKQGEQMPSWAYTLKDINGDDITQFDVEIKLKGGASTIILYPGQGIGKVGSMWYVDNKLENDVPARSYVVDVRMVLADGKVYKIRDFIFSINSSFNNG